MNEYNFFLRMIEFSVALAVSLDIVAMGLGMAVKTYRGITKEKEKDTKK